MTTCYEIAIPGWQHRFNETECQDVVRRKTKRGRTAVVICDGAGSYQHAGLGARVMAETFASWGVDNFYALLHRCNADIVEQAVWLIRDTLCELAWVHQADEIEFGSTLLMAVYDDSGRHLILHLGDGAVIAQDYDGRVFALSEPEGYQNATYLTTSSIKSLYSHVRVYRADRLEGLMLCSDGAKDILYALDDGRLTLNKGIQNLFRLLREDKRTFSEAFCAFLANKAKPVDDFSVAMTVHTMGERLAQPLGSADRTMRRRRVLRSYARYLDAMQTGVSPTYACRYAGWRKKYWRRNMARVDDIISEVE